MRFAFLFFSLVAFAFAAEPTDPAPALRFESMPSPAAANALGSSLATAPDGTAWLSWVEPGADGTHTLRVATFDTAAKKWSAPQTIASGRTWYINWTDFPSLTIGERGRATAVWSVNNPEPIAPPAAASAPDHNTHHAAAPAADHSAHHASASSSAPSATPVVGAHVHSGPGYHAVVSRTADGGKTWSPAAPLTRETDGVEFVALATLADGRVLASWLDGRGKKAGGPTQLYTRIVGGDGPDVRVDASVCDCCPTTLTAFPDGTALIAYRGRSPEEVRDIRVARFRGDVWDASRPLHQDNWKINGCPVNGPQLASDGGRVAAAWFTAADNDPRVQVTFSPDAGARFLVPLRLDTEKPAGRVDTVLLRNGALLVSWVALDGGLWLRRVSPDYTLSAAVQLAPAGTAQMKTVARMALVRDYQGGKSAAQALVTYTQDGAGVRTLLVTIPESDLLEAERNCDCLPPAIDLQGFPMRGTIEAGGAPGTLRVKHPELPGLFAGGTHEFKVAPDNLPAAATPGRQFLGRIERRDGAWWIFDVRLIASPGK